MVYLYGDDGINCVAGNEIRRRLLNKIPFNSQIEGLGTLEWDNNLIPILPDVHKNKHVIACINIGCDVLCAISLFGVFNKVLIFKNEKINESDLLGCVFNIDFRQRKITRENFAERILNNFYS